MGLVSVLFMLVSPVVNTVSTVSFMRQLRTGISCESRGLAIVLRGSQLLPALSSSLWMYTVRFVPRHNAMSPHGDSYRTLLDERQLCRGKFYGTSSMLSTEHLFSSAKCGLQCRALLRSHHSCRFTVSAFVALRFLMFILRGL